MELLEEKIEFTRQELEQWFSNPDCENNYYQKRVSEIEDRLKNGTSLKSIFRQFDYLEIWYSKKIVSNELINQTSIAAKMKNASNGYETIVISDLIAQEYPNNPPKLIFQKVSYWLANCTIQKWYSQSRELIDIINKGLTTKFLKGGFHLNL